MASGFRPELRDAVVYTRSTCIAVANKTISIIILYTSIQQLLSIVRHDYTSVRCLLDNTREPRVSRVFTFRGRSYTDVSYIFIFAREWFLLSRARRVERNQFPTFLHFQYIRDHSQRSNSRLTTNKSPISKTHPRRLNRAFSSCSFCSYKL
jgi:hypothetical protein